MRRRVRTSRSTLRIMAGAGFPPPSPIQAATKPPLFSASMAAIFPSPRVYPVSRISSLPATTSAAVLFPFTVYFILISFVFVFLFIANQQGDNTASVPTCQQLFSVNVIFFCGLFFFFLLIELVEQGGGL